jgi:tetratricopeptide (TPR) repeat protein
MDDRTKQLLALGKEHYDKREFEKAEHYLIRVVAQARSYPDVLNMLGVIAHDRGQFEEAEKFFKEALAINPRYTEAALNLAVTYNDLGQYDEAKKIYQQARNRNQHGSSTLEPYVRGKIANLHDQISQAYAEVGWLAQAIQELRKAIALCPDFPDLRLRMATLCREAGSLEESTHELEEAIRIKADYIQARIALGVNFLEMGQVSKAMEHWHKALEYDPDNKSAQMYVRVAEKASSSMGPSKS